MAIIQFRIEFAVADMVINVFNHRQNSRNIMSHVRYFGITDATACGLVFKLRFKGKFIEYINRFAYIYMVAVRIVTLIGNIFNITEAGTVLLAEAMGQAFCRCTVQGKADIRFFTPLFNMFVQIIHNTVSKSFAFRSRMRNTLGQQGSFIHTDIAEGQRRIAAVHELFYRFTRFKSGNGPILPVNGRYIGRNLLQ